MKTAIVWFRNDLRLHDHEALHKAILENEQVIPFYCFEEEQFGVTDYGFQKTGSFRAQFLIESVSVLRKNLKLLGSDLIVRKGNIAENLSSLAKISGATSIYAFKDIHPEEIAVQQAVEEKFKGKINYFFGSTLFHVNDLAHHYNETPKIFTDFRKGVEKKSRVRELYPKPKKLPPINEIIAAGKIPKLKHLGLVARNADERAAIKGSGGEDEALKRLKYYFFESQELSEYKLKRNGLIGSDYSSKLSLWLWNGCISPRKIYWEVKKYEKEVEKNQSTYWLIFELIWRDYFKFISLKHGNALFSLHGIKNERYDWIVDKDLFNLWAEGKTGIPFVDANMRELNQTGFMSNRGRQNVASFLIKELGLDWRMGAAYFESMLIDYDVASNYGNWMYLAGVGNDPRDRYFNIISQAKRYDPNGEYVKMWLPELNELDKHLVHHPWTSEAHLLNKKASDYPLPIRMPDYWEKYY